MTYALIKGDKAVEYPLYEGDIRLRFPNTSFPIPFAPPNGYVAVVDMPMPDVDWWQEVVEGMPVFIDGKWQRSWLIGDASDEEKAKRTDEQAVSMRVERNKRLTNSDWTQLPDAPVDDSEWAAYRQALREVPEQAGFPWAVEWPQEP